MGWQKLPKDLLQKRRKKKTSAHGTKEYWSGELKKFTIQIQMREMKAIKIASLWRHESSELRCWKQ